MGVFSLLVVCCWWYTGAGGWEALRVGFENEECTHTELTQHVGDILARDDAVAVPVQDLKSVA